MSPIDIKTFWLAATPAGAEESTEPITIGEPTAEPVVIVSDATPDAATTEEATAVVREWIACLNGQDLQRYLALATVEYLLDWIAVRGLILPDELAPLSPPLQASLIGINAVSTLSDGRLAVEFTLSDPRNIGVTQDGHVDISDVQVVPEITPDAL